MTTQWRTYNYYGADRTPIADLPWDTVTHVLHVYTGVLANGDIDFDQVVQMSADIAPLIAAAHAHGVKVLLCIGALDFPGGPQCGTNLYNAALANAWVAGTKISGAVNAHGYDGVALDIEWGQDFATSFPVLTNLIRCLRLQLPNPKLLTCAAVAHHVHAQVWGNSEALRYLDRLHIMAMNMVNYSTGRTNHNGALYTGSYVDDAAPISVNEIMRMYVSYGCPAAKLNLVLMFYGWKLTGYAGPYQGQTGHVPGTAPDQEKTYRAIVDEDLPGATSVTTDPVARVPLAQYAGGQQWVSFDDYDSISAKVAWVRQNGFGGIDAHQIGGDYFPNETPKHRLWQAVIDGYAAPAPAGDPNVYIDVDEGSLLRLKDHGQVFSGQIAGPNAPANIDMYLSNAGLQMVTWALDIPIVDGRWSWSFPFLVGTGEYWLEVFMRPNNMLAKHKFIVREAI